MKIKIGRDEIAIKKNDRITFDGENYSLLSGDIRPLKIEGNTHHCFMHLPKTTFSKIPKSVLRRKRKSSYNAEWEFK